METDIKESNPTVYDPRINKWIESDNPGLLVGNLLAEDVLTGPDSQNLDKQFWGKFWGDVKSMANTCDKIEHQLNQ